MLGLNLLINRNGGEIYPNVTNWLSSSDVAIGNAEELVQRKDEQVKKRCFVGLCPNFMSRYHLGKDAVIKASTIEKLRNEGGLDPISFMPPLQQIVEPSVYSPEALPSRVLILNQIMDALRDPNLNMIGVYGMGGVGKTTLAKEAQGKAVADKLFDDVIFVAVSQTPELGRIQAEIADFLGLKFVAEELSGRASQLYKRLEKKSKVLIILDDLWQKLDLNAVGIPFGDATKDFKIMLTSRNSYLLSSEMRAQKMFSLEALKDDETLSLFEMSIAQTKDPQFHAIATEIAKKCEGLPLLIQLVSTDLQNKVSDVWEEKLNQLSALGEGEIYQKVHRVLQSSYDNLPGDETKSFFLLCAMFGQSNIQIQYLLTHGMGLGLFEHTRNIEGARAKVITLIDVLKCKSLLLDGDMIGFIKMHDVVRDIAVSIASRVQHAFIGLGLVGLSDWPKNECTRISFLYSDLHQLPVGLDCPEAELFLLSTEDLCLGIPDSFFEGIRKLKVVDLTGMRLASLPSSIGVIKNLQTLCLHRCRLDDVAMVGELEQLLSLSFANSKIGELPREIEALTRLKLLDLRNCAELNVIPENVFSKLRSLEELYMLNSFVRWNAKGQARLVELDNLSDLSTLEIQIVNSKLIPQNSRFFHNLMSYKISIGDEWGYWGGNDERSRTLKLKLDAGIHLEDGINRLLKGAEVLYLSEGKGIESVLYDLDQEGFPLLKHLHIQNDFDIQHLIKSTRRASCVSFPILESLHLEKICDAQLEMGSFGELRSIKIWGCDKLKSLFSFASAKCLSHLQEMEVESCENMEAVVDDGSEAEHNNNEVIEFVQLRSLKLQNLPNLTSFCKREVVTAPMELLFNEMVSLPNLTSLDVFNCKSLKYVFAASMVECLLKLKKLDISDCELVEEIIQSKKDEEIEEESIKAIVFPKLDYLRLQYLQNVKRFSCGYSIEFPLLRELMLSCKTMKNFVSKFSSHESDEEYLFNEKLPFSNLERLELSNMNFKYLWDAQLIRADDDSFSKLKSLTIDTCSKLSIVFPSHVFRRFQKLEGLRVSNCNGVEVIYQYQGINFKEIKNVEAFSLRNLSIYDLPSLKNIWSNDPCGAFTFQNLQSVDVWSCENLKYVFPASIACGLLQLQQLKISYCKNVEAIIANEKDERSDPSFQFSSMNKISITGNKAPMGIFGFRKLRVLKIYNCSRLKYVFTWSMALRLFDLQEVHLKNCEMMESIVKEEEVDDAGRRVLEFPSMNKISITECPSFISFVLRLTRECKDGIEENDIHFSNKPQTMEVDSWEDISGESSEDDHYKDELIESTQSSSLKQKTPPHAKGYFNKKEGTGSIELLFNEMVSFPKLTSLAVRGCKSLKYVFTTSSVNWIMQLQNLQIQDCELMEEVILNMEFEESIWEIVFPNLNYILLEELPKLKRFSCVYPIKCQSHIELSIIRCAALKNFLSIYSGTLKHIQKKESQLNPIFHFLHTLNVNGSDDLMNITPSSASFQNLTTLSIERCRKLKSLVTASTAKTMVQLREMMVYDCEMMEEIVANNGNRIEHDEIVFGKLKVLKLIDLYKLSSFCSGNYSFNFPSLEEVAIYSCARLSIFCGGVLKTPKLGVILFEDAQRWKGNVNTTIACQSRERVGGHFEEGRLFPNVELLEVAKEAFSSIAILANQLQFLSKLNKIVVRDCDSVQVVFDLEGLTGEDGNVGPELNELHLINLPVLSQLCNKAPSGFLEYVNRLKVLKVDNCSRLKCAFSWSMALRLVYLREIELRNCEMMEAVMEDEEEEDTNDADKVIFGSLESITLENLPNFLGFYSGIRNFECPLLENMSIRECPSMRAFISTLPSGDAEGKEAHNIHFSHSVSFPNLTVLEVRRCDSLEYVFSTSMVKCVSQLKKLEISYCELMEGIIQNTKYQEMEEENINKIVFSKLDYLLLEELPNVKRFGSGYPIEFPSLKELKIKECPAMENFVSISSGDIDESDEYFFNENIEGLTVDITQLRSLKMKNLPHLNAEEGTREMKSISDIAPLLLFNNMVSFPNLTSLEVKGCKSLKYVFTPSMLKCVVQLKMLEIGYCELVEEIIMSKEFEDLEKDNIDKIVFPKLEYLSLEGLPDTIRFTHGYQIEFPLLRELSIVRCSVLKNFVSKFSDRKNSNTSEEYLFNEMVTFPNLKTMNVRHTHNFKYLWHDQHADSFFKLKVLKIECCSKLSVVFPSNVHRTFRNIETLYLSSCPRIKEIYQYEGINSEEVNTVEAAFALRELHIKILPSLKHIWSKDPHGVTTFSHLQSVKVLSCKALKYVFPKSIAHGLLRLEHLKILKCDVDVIIAKAEGEEHLESIASFQFPRLTSLQLENLNEMKSLYPGPHIFECAKLKSVGVSDCDQLMKFSSRISTYQHLLPSQDSLLFAEKILPNLEELTLDHQGLETIQRCEFSVEFFSKLKTITLRSLEVESIPLLNGFLEGYILEKLVFAENYLEEIFSLDLGAPTILRLQHLELVGDDNLKHIVKKHSVRNPVLEYVESLNVKFCDDLISIAPSSASFRSLTTLDVGYCGNMVNLVTASTAKTMVHLKNLRVSNCYLMEEIVAKDDDCGDYDEIIFNELKYLELNDLSRLKSFCSSKYTLSFPLLEQVVVERCFRMRIFCGGLLSVARLLAILEDEQSSQGNLNGLMEILKNGGSSKF